MCQGAYSSHIDKLVKIGSQSAGGAAMSASALRQCRWVHWQGPLTTPSPPDVAYLSNTSPAGHQPRPERPRGRRAPWACRRTLLERCCTKRRPPEPHRCAALVPNASRMLPSYRRPRLWPRAPQVRRLVHGLGVLCAPSRRVRELRKPQLRRCVMLQDCTAAHRPKPHY